MSNKEQKKDLGFWRNTICRHLDDANEYKGTLRPDVEPELPRVVSWMAMAGIVAIITILLSQLVVLYIL